MPALRLRMVTCNAPRGYRKGVLTIISWFAARRNRQSLQALVSKALTDAPTVLRVVNDKYMSESALRPWTPLAERFGDRLHFILAAEFDQLEREREGGVVLRSLGVPD